MTSRVGQNHTSTEYGLTEVALLGLSGLHLLRRSIDEPLYTQFQNCMVLCVGKRPIKAYGEAAMSHSTSVSALVRHHRVAAGLSQEALSEKAGVSVRGLSDLERGRSRAPRLDTLNRLSEALGLDDAQRLALVQASGHLGSDDRDETRSDAYAAPEARPCKRGVEAKLAHVPDAQLVGRDAEAAEVRGLLEQCTTRLLTLSGPGGVGKTRLAATVASNMSDAYAGGVIFIELASISDPDLVLSLIAQALGIGERGDQTVLFDRVVLALRDERRLLVLDNFEHVLSAASLLSDLLRETSEVYMLVTSRALLRLSCEQVFTVPPLPLPSRTSSARPKRPRAGPPFNCSRCVPGRPAQLRSHTREFREHPGHLSRARRPAARAGARRGARERAATGDVVRPTPASPLGAHQRAAGCPQSPSWAARGDCVELRPLEREGTALVPVVGRFRRRFFVEHGRNRVRRARRVA